MAYVGDESDEAEKDKILTELDEELLATKELQRQVQHAGVNLDEVSLPDVDTDAMISRLNQSVEDLVQQAGSMSPSAFRSDSASFPWLHPSVGAPCGRRA